MSKISALDDITTLAATDKLPVVDVSDTTNNLTGENKYTTPAEIKTYVLGSGVDIGTNTAGDIVTVDGTQDITNKTISGGSLKDFAVTGTNTFGQGCTMTLPVLNTPGINGGTIDGAVIDDTTTVEIDAGAVACSTLVNKTAAQTMTNKTLTTPVVASVYQDSGKTNLLTMPAATDTLVGKATTDTLTNKTLTAPIIATLKQTAGGGVISVPASAGADTVVLADATQTLTAKTLTSPTINTPTISGGTITGAAIDDTTTLNGVAVSTALSAKADVGEQITHNCTILLANGAGTSDTVTASEILTAVGISGISKTYYDILALTLHLTLWWNDSGTMKQVCIDGSTVTAELTVSGSGVNSLLTQVDIDGLTGSEVYYLACSFKALAVA